jgi:hypothetical protein
VAGGCLPWVTASSLPDFKPILQMKDDILEEEISGQALYRPGCNYQAASPLKSIIPLILRTGTQECGDVLNLPVSSLSESIILGHLSIYKCLVETLQEPDMNSQM